MQKVGAVVNLLACSKRIWLRFRWSVRWWFEQYFWIGKHAAERTDSICFNQEQNHYSPISVAQSSPHENPRRTVYPLPVL